MGAVGAATTYRREYLLERYNRCEPSTVLKLSGSDIVPASVDERILKREGVCYLHMYNAPIVTSTIIASKHIFISADCEGVPGYSYAEASYALYGGVRKTAKVEVAIIRKEDCGSFSSR